MLKVLRRLVQEVSSAKNLGDALNTLVHRLRESIDTQAASVYLVHYRRAEYVLAATDGLNAHAVGKIRVPLSQGLLGLIGRREEPINIEDASAHPDFFHHPEAGEEEFKAFLGVPIIHHRRLYGILTVQQEEQRCFDEAEEAFLVTLAAQLGNIIAQAEASNALDELMFSFSGEAIAPDTMVLTGLSSVSGIGIGYAVTVYPPADLDSVPDIEVEDVEKEATTFFQAVEKTRQDLDRLGKKLKTGLPEEEQALFDVYNRLLSEGSLMTEIARLIREEKMGAQVALSQVIRKYVQRFESMEDEYLRERGSDFRDLGRRVLANLQASEKVNVDYPAETILVGEEITAAALAEVPEGRLKGILSAKGSSNSHVAILARTLGVPTVMGVLGLPLKQIADEQVVIDGYSGHAYISPSPARLEEFRQVQQEEKELNEKLETLRDKKTQTLDGHPVALYVNTGLSIDTALSLSVGADGVGLYRSEMPFMVRDRFPSEEEQRVIYRQLLKAFAPRAVTMRTLDIGGDKTLPYFPIEEENPFLGWRGIRVTLDHPDVFLMQIRAMLQASEDIDNLQILFPMISGVVELDEALRLMDKAYNEVLEEGRSIKRPKVGAMIEVPAAAYQAREIAKRVDFISIGTNDLTQYLLAVDRNNPRVASLYDSLHPAVLRCLMQIMEAARHEGTAVSICGEMASDPMAVLVLLGMGFDSFSINSSCLARVKWIICNFSLEKAQKILSEVLVMDNPMLIRFHLERVLHRAGLGNMIRSG